MAQAAGRVTVTSARDDILARLKRAPASQQSPDTAEAPTPTVGGDLMAVFRENAAAAGVTISEVTDPENVGGAIADYLRHENLPARVLLAPDAGAYQAQIAAAIEVADLDATADGVAVVSGCHAAVAETGTLVMTSGEKQDTRLNYLAETHIVVLNESQLVGPYEAAWTDLRGSVPRTVSFITGPSRTADIEQTIERGAHGPRRLHIVICRENP